MMTYYCYDLIDSCVKFLPRLLQPQPSRMHCGSPTLAGWQACSSADDDEGQPYLWVMDYLEIGVCFCAEACSRSQGPGIADLRDFGLPLPGLSFDPKQRNPNSNSFCSPFWARGCESQSDFGCRDVLERSASSALNARARFIGFTGFIENPLPDF